jgi:hypothetical protein
MVWFSVRPGSLFYTYSKRNGTNTPHAITPPLPDTRLYTSPRHTLPPILYRPLLCLTFPLARPAPSPIPSHVINCPAFPYTLESTSSLWRWNWHMVPKRRQTTNWRRGSTQKNIYNIWVWSQFAIQSTLTNTGRPTTDIKHAQNAFCSFLKQH